jgi:hypothetical protein
MRSKIKPILKHVNIISLTHQISSEWVKCLVPSYWQEILVERIKWLWEWWKSAAWNDGCRIFIYYLMLKRIIWKYNFLFKGWESMAKNLNREGSIRSMRHQLRHREPFRHLLKETSRPRKYVSSTRIFLNKVSRFNSYRSENTFRFHYQSQQENAF